MMPGDRLEKLRQLQYKCKGQGKENLYHLIAMQGAPPDHEELRRRLAKKRDSWSKMADKAAHLEIVEEALELLRTPSDKAEYDRFILSPVEPQGPPPGPQPPWGYDEGHDQPPMPPPPDQEQTPPRRRAGLSISTKLGLAGLGLMALSWVMTIARITPPETTRTTPTVETGTADRGAGTTAGRSSTNGEPTSRSSPSTRRTPSPRTADGGGAGDPATTGGPCADGSPDDTRADG